MLKSALLGFEVGNQSWNAHSKGGQHGCSIWSESTSRQSAIDCIRPYYQENDYNGSDSNLFPHPKFDCERLLDSKLEIEAESEICVLFLESGG